DSITASSTLRSRSVRSTFVMWKSCSGINLATNSRGGQDRHDLIKPEPSLRRQAIPLSSPDKPALIGPGFLLPTPRGLRPLLFGEAVVGAKTEIETLDPALRLGQHFALVGGIAARADNPLVLGPGIGIPASLPMRKRVCGGPKPGIGTFLPVGTVVPAVVS